jgi:hypothetical protein
MDKAIEAMALTMSEGDSNPENLNKFIWHVVKESGTLVNKNPVKTIENYANGRVLINPNSKYNILKPMEVKTFSHRIIDRFKVINNQHFLV